MARLLAFLTTRDARARRAQGWVRAEQLIDALAELTDAQREVLKLRWLEEAKRYDRAWRLQRLTYYCLRIPIIAGAATVPVLAGLAVAKLATAMVGLGVAILTGVDSLFRLGLRWQQERRAANTIIFEGWQFLELSGPDYQGAERGAAYTVFLGRLEALNERISSAYLELFADEGQSPRQQLQQ
jgi:hypothetical protein